jgi:hypothetical protein
MPINLVNSANVKRDAACGRMMRRALGKARKLSRCVGILQRAGDEYWSVLKRSGKGRRWDTSERLRTSASVDEVLVEVSQ